MGGTIPPELGGLSNLEQLLLNDNQLSGSVQVGRTLQLRSLLLSSNQLSGEIPSELGELSNLQDLSLGGNELSGIDSGRIGRTFQPGIAAAQW